MDVVSSLEKDDTKISHFGSVVCFRGHILWENVEVPNSASQENLDLNECNFGSSSLWAEIHLTLSKGILYERVAVIMNNIDIVNWITAHNYGKPKWHTFMMNQYIAGLGIIFLTRRYLIPWYRLLQPHAYNIMGSGSFRSYWGTLYRD